MAETHYSRLTFDALTGWADDDHQAALDVFLGSADAIDGAVWRAVAQAAADADNARSFFETYFEPVEISDGQPALLTGYYEPECKGALERSDAYPVPAYGVPPDFRADEPYLTRRQIEEEGRLVGQGLEVAWFADPVDLFFMQVQGSGRLRLPDGSMVRLGFAAKNGRAYQSVGQVLIGRGALQPGAVSPDRIRAWLLENADEAAEVLWQNESYVFFKRIDDVPAETGPLGAMGRPVTALRSIAVDPAYVPLGALVWLEKPGDDPMARLMVAQDVGSAILGAQRADIFCGTGDDAGRKAGAINQTGRLATLLPRAMATALCGPA